jgi:hypothetical protein
MFPDCIQQLAHVHEARAIHLQGFDRSAPGWCQTYDSSIITTPAKVRLPLLLSGVEEWNPIAIGRIWRFGFVVLPSVTARTCQSEIGEFTCPTTAERTHVLDGKCLCGVIGLALAIFTAVVGTLDDRSLRVN